ncbi:glutathione S-transferase family protein [uncultured Caulobacter sp.]|jgi:GST-like protein|uniref:glutathione S-transferase family protein n=1 Tax=uncultured Caulobacter sp. TaxID=158749 RepID=UPI002601DFC0|nr:glutathione S-transferase family protein [uncultured Caulobacter sp.]
MVNPAYTIYGAPGSGSVPVEAALTLIGQPYSVIEAPTWEGESERAKVAAINPLKQIPALVTPGGETITESAAILIWLADRYPEAGLAPTTDDPARAQFLRWMTFIPASIYALYWISDEPSRLVGEDEALQAMVKAAIKDRIVDCWRMMEAQVSPGRYLLGDELTVLDLYVTVLSRWGPRRVRFYEAAPKMAEVVKRVDADPRLAGFWEKRFPFFDGWERLGSAGLAASAEP